MDYKFHEDYIGFADPDEDRSLLKFPTGKYRMNLFHEFNITAHEDYPPLYTMRELPFRGLPSAYLIFMTSATEYEAAMKLMGSWQHWKRYVKNCGEFLNGSRQEGQAWEGLAFWREEKELRDAGKAYQQLKESAQLGNVTAQKEIWNKTTKKRAGRPSKDQIQTAAQEAAEYKKVIKEDLKRITLVVKDGKQVRN